MAAEPLGICLAANGDTSTQFHRMLGKAKDWVDNMKHGCLSRQEAWTALHTTIICTLMYPQPVLNLSQQQAEKIMSVLVQYALPAMGICRSFPRHQVFSSLNYFHLGIPHLFTVQKILCIKDIIKHQYLEFNTGQLYATSLELLHIELGLTKPLNTISYPLLHHLTSDSLVKST
jgi:hypothetical protein